jgi:structural maintenance of chromosome 2
MFIEELWVDGFKSYSTRTNVGPFDKQFNAITGLNGSGKSNILDSICFVLGISNLSQVRVGNLSELVYKQGQAGITKASVTMVLNNEDKASGPLGYDSHDKITITRQIVIGGRNRYILNSHTVQANQIQNLFHSVSLNVNNPHFLIMQGRITKVINMKPQETLSMIEEAAGTRMYENKKAGALKTLEKKQNKVDEINRLLSEEITPTLEKLQKERANYMQWVSNNNLIERLQRFCVAYDYVQVKGRLEGRNKQLEEMEAALAQLLAEGQRLADRDTKIQEEMKQRTASRDKQKAKELKALEDDHTKLSKEIVSTESKLKNWEKDLASNEQKAKNSESEIGDLKRKVEVKQKAYDKEKAKWDVLNEQDSNNKKEIENAQWTIQALSAGMSTQRENGEGEQKSLKGQLLEAQTRLSELESDEKKKKILIVNLKDRIKGYNQIQEKSKQDGKRLTKEKSVAENFIAEKRAELQALGFDPDSRKALVDGARQAESSLYQAQERLDMLRAHLSGLDFNYADPNKGFDRSAVKGVVSKLFHIRPEAVNYHRALEVCAGGRLYFVVVDDEGVGKALLERGQLRRRVTIIPLNKIVDPTIPAHVVRQARAILPEGGECHLAYEIIGCDKSVQSAMKFVFGGYLVCDSAETAKKVTFHPNVRVRTVTRDGDLYDPAGTITGGSAPKGGNILMKLQELQDLEGKVQQQRSEYELLRKQLQKSQAGSASFDSLERDLKCKEHELSLIEDRISHSEHHAAEQAVQQMQEQLRQTESDLQGLPDEKSRLDKAVKQLGKDIKSLEGGREDRISHLEQQVERLKGEAKQWVDKLEKQREKTEQANVELEVMKGEEQAVASKDQESGQSNAQAKEQIATDRAAMEETKVKYDDIGKKLDALRDELKQLDDTLGKLGTELAGNRQKREELELEQKRATHKVQQLQKDDKEAGAVAARLEAEHPWIAKEKDFFGKKGTDFDFEANSYKDNKAQLEKLNQKQKTLGKNINKKAMAMFEKAEQEYKDLLSKRDIILNDKHTIEKVIKDLDEKKSETLRRTWVKVNKDFNSIFSMLLVNTNAKLEPPQGMDCTEGLELKVAFNGVWKQSLSELSGGQRSLLALSLVLALLLFKPAPMYILDEIDSALDLSHTQNIGHMIRTHFPHSQFIVVSLKEGMFNHANCLFRTRFIDGTSTVTRYAIRDGEEPDAKKRKKGALA